MIVRDTAQEMLSAFDSGRFSLEKWKACMDASLPEAKELCLNDMEESIRAGCSWETDYLPVLNSVLRDTEKREKAVSSFHAVTDRLNGKIMARFGRTVDARVILYLGLCNGAGWVTPLHGQTYVLIGIEKIMELNWCGADAMTGLILHELGHAYHSQYGTPLRETGSLPDSFLWQLFTEGVAMVFEQEIVGNPAYFHQERDGWKRWCDLNAERIRQSFEADRTRMTRESQRYFGDWVRFEGRGDTGYYLGARFVRFLLLDDRFDRVILYGPEEVTEGYGRFLRSELNQPI